MEPSRIERALRSGPPDEPPYRPRPLALDAAAGVQSRYRGLAGNVAAAVATLAVVVLASAAAFAVLSPGFGPAGDGTPPEAGEWGPLAVTTSPGNGDAALMMGAIRISDECVVLETIDDRPTLLVWSSGQASWDPQERRILFRARDGAVVELQDGQQVGLGGSGRDLSTDRLSPEDQDGPSWDEWLTTISWAAEPDPACRAQSVWFVGEVIIDQGPSVVPPTIDPSLVAVPTQDPELAGSPGPCRLGLTGGTLVSDERWGLAIENRDGSLQKVLWPHGYAARREASRLALIDGNGSVVAYEGDLVRMGGGLSGTDDAWGACGDITVVGGGHEALLREMRDAGLDVKVDSRFTATPLAASGVALCFMGQIVQVFEYDTQAEAESAVASIDPDDPSHVGGSDVEWIGDPKFWQGDRVIVLYVGADAVTEDALDALLGEPFASGRGRGFSEERDC